jgi:amphi-Trp domain-containing protein
VIRERDRWIRLFDFPDSRHLSVHAALPHAVSRNYETELTATREEVAAVLSGVTDGVLAGSIRLGDGADAVSVDVLDELSLEIEVDTDDDGVSVELEAEWPHAEGSAADADAEGSAADADSPDGSDDALAAADPPVPVGADDGSESLARFELFRDRRDEWRWRLRHRNGNVIATGGEGYTRKHNARKGLRSVVANAPGAEIREE